MSKLFMVYLGGSAPKANIELHDVQFAVADTIEGTYDQLIENWFGTAKGLHLDSYTEIRGADGHRITLECEPQGSDKRLYFVNLGGYQKDRLNELHEFGLFVAGSAAEAKRKAKAALLTDANQTHKDNLMEVDDCLRISQISGWHIHLHETSETFNLEPDWFGYHVIG
ncbi:DUF1543 domain-containing protein [Marinobacterium sp. AK62]|uniref:DUF1543 domain-containing protein n=1 Tax=Marinobacterium alkalitolerans TaxID=1542925 RepID=A0ABS3Z8D0_9GAMM|nr:DUF1543 domain-containing protein [Marinobacterium alkalitolerans]MBP0047942.1 DUF1543 domain-containing protein [Marinobacterium alkalitolerans]